jgi:hypothetical protein
MMRPPVRSTRNTPARPARAHAAKAPPMPRWAWWLLALAVAAPLAVPLVARAQDRAELDRTQVIGNRELPKVLYIVPWKKPLHGNMGGRAVTGVVDEALAPIDRDVLRRQVSYDAQIRASVAGAAPVAAPAATRAATKAP